MRIDVQEKPMKIAAFWVSKAEAADKDFMDSLRPQFKAWKRKNYLPVVYEAGEENIEDNIYMLMRHNYDLKVRNESVPELLNA